MAACGLLHGWKVECSRRASSKAPRHSAATISPAARLRHSLVGRKLRRFAAPPPASSSPPSIAHHDGAAHAHAAEGPAIRHARPYACPPSHYALTSNLLIVEAYLIAFGDDRNPLPETVRVLDEIITEYVRPCLH